MASIFSAPILEARRQQDSTLNNLDKIILKLEFYTQSINQVLG